MYPNLILRELSGSVVECLTGDRGAADLSLTGVAALCHLARHIYPSLVLVQPRKTRPYINERLLMGHKESNETNNLILVEILSLQQHQSFLSRTSRESMQQHSQRQKRFYGASWQRYIE